MNLTDQTRITVQFPDTGEANETTWGEFAADNSDDAETLDDVRQQIEAGNRAVIGGGAAPVILIFA